MVGPVAAGRISNGNRGRRRRSLLFLNCVLHFLGGEGFEIGKSAAGGDAGPFEERGVQDEGAAVHEGMIGGFERFARAAVGAGAGDKVFVHFQIGLKIEGVANVPALVAGEGREEFLAEGGSFLAFHGLGFAFVLGGQAADDNFEGTGSYGEKSFALEKIQKIAVENSVDLQAVAAVFNDVGIDKTGDDAFAKEGFAEALW